MIYRLSSQLSDRIHSFTSFHHFQWVLIIFNSFLEQQVDTTFDVHLKI